MSIDKRNNNNKKNYDIKMDKKVYNIMDDNDGTGGDLVAYEMTGSRNVLHDAHITSHPNVSWLRFYQQHLLYTSSWKIGKEVII